MAPADWSWGQTYDAPVLTMLPQQHIFERDPHYGNDISMGQTQTSATFPTPAVTTPQNIPTSNTTAMTNGPDWQIHNVQPLKTSRKRSREDFDEDASSESTTNAFPSATPSPPKQEPVMGPGMTLIYPDRPIIGADSQTGTWAEELSERLRSSALTKEDELRRERPVLESRKSIRLDRSGAGLDDVAVAALPRDTRMSMIKEPSIDEASIALGIAWTTIPTHSTMAQASRGWARYIETHFPLQSVNIVWKNNSLPAYLVSAVTCEPLASPEWGRKVEQAGYYLLDEGLSEGKLVARSWEQALENLRATPMRFEGEKVLQADEDEAARSVESSNMQHWAGWRASRDVTPVPAVAVATMADGMDLD